MLCRHNLLLAAVALGAAACTSYSSYSPAPYGPAGYGVAHINAATRVPFGSYLVDGQGRALYILDGQRGAAGMDRCMGECLRIWPPLHSSGAPTAGPGVDPARLASMPMHGAPHVTYAGWPLYYYHRDRRPGDTTGQAIQDRWGRWYLLSPSGEPIRPSGGY